MEGTLKLRAYEIEARFYSDFCNIVRVLVHILDDENNIIENTGKVMVFLIQPKEEFEEFTKRMQTKSELICEIKKDYLNFDNIQYKNGLYALFTNCSDSFIDGDFDDSASVLEPLPIR